MKLLIVTDTYSQESGSGDIHYSDNSTYHFVPDSFDINFVKEIWGKQNKHKLSEIKNKHFAKIIDIQDRHEQKWASEEAEIKYEAEANGMFAAFLRKNMEVEPIKFQYYHENTNP